MQSLVILLEKPRKNDYVGETDRVLRKRLYEHKIIDHKTANQAASIRNVPGTDPEKTQGTRRSARQEAKRKQDYKALQEGSNQALSEGNTEFSAHVAC